MVGEGEIRLVHDHKAERTKKLGSTKILPLLNGSSRDLFCLGPVNRQAKAKAMAWYFSSSGFPSNNFLESMTFYFPSENGNSLTEPKIETPSTRKKSQPEENYDCRV